jgi:DNA-directed RNA polymerase sigma subunit (sigma70/sigma32)
MKSGLLQGEKEMKHKNLSSSLKRGLKGKGNFTLIKEEVQKSLTQLKKREVEILRMRYGLDGYKRSTLSEVGKQFNITAERVRQIQVCALKKLLQTIDLNEKNDTPLPYK